MSSSSSSSPERTNKKQRISPRNINPPPSLLSWLKSRIGFPDSEDYIGNDSDLDSDSAPEEENKVLVSSDQEIEDGEEKINNNIINKEGWLSIHKNIKVEEFTCYTGLTRLSSQCESPLDFFSLFITHEMILQFVNATNSYGSTKLNNNWTNINRNDMIKFLSVIIFMGLSLLPSLHDYWAEDFKSPYILKLFPRRQDFLILYRCFYINTGERNLEDPIWHVRPLFNSIKNSFPRHFTPDQLLVFDEMMVPCKARSKLKQYVKSKPHRWGYKIWCLESNGYILDISIYNGTKLSGQAETPSEALLRMTEAYKGMNHLIFMNNLFSSPGLFSTLLNKKIFASGTIRPNRIEFPKELVQKMKKRTRGSWEFLQKNK